MHTRLWARQLMCILMCEVTTLLATENSLVTPRNNLEKQSLIDIISSFNGLLNPNVFYHAAIASV